MGISIGGSEILAEEVVAPALADGVVNCDIVCRIDGNCLVGSIRTVIGIRTRDSVGVRIADRYGRIRTCIVPRVIECTVCRQCRAAPLAKGGVAADNDVRQRVDGNDDRRGG